MALTPPPTRGAVLASFPKTLAADPRFWPYQELPEFLKSFEKSGVGGVCLPFSFRRGQKSLPPWGVIMAGCRTADKADMSIE